MAPYLELCRLCAQKKKIRSDIYATGSTVAQKIMACLNLKITQDDLLPKLICIECHRNLDLFHTFKLRCRRSENKLTKAITSHPSNKSFPATSIKQESVEYVAPIEPIDHTYAAATNSSRSNVKIEVDVEHTDRDETLNCVASDLNKHVIEVFVDNEAEGVENPTNTDADANISHVEKKPLVAESTDYGCQDQNENNEPVIYEIEDDSARPTVDCRCPTSITDNTARPTVDFQCPTSTTDNAEPAEDLPAVDAAKPASKYLQPPAKLEITVDMEEYSAMLQKKLNPNFEFKCKKCARSFKFYKGLKKHEKSHEDESVVYICDICLLHENSSIEYATYTTLKMHILKQHLAEKHYQCPKCEARFRTRSMLSSHDKKVHPNTECNVCGKICKSASLLKSHMVVHSTLMPYICEVCARAFRWRSAFKVHLGTHRENRDFLCAECGKRFVTKKNLAEHSNLHRGAKPYSCEQCGLSFSHKSSLSRHRFLHNAEPQSCPVCGKKLSCSNLLNKHLRIHTGERPFKCDCCPRAFHLKSNLYNHKKSHGEKTHLCTTCGVSFAKRGYLLNHLVIHTGAKHICPAPGCGKAYSQRFPLSKHFRGKHPDMQLLSRRPTQGADLKEESSDNQNICYSFSYEVDIADVIN